MALSVVCLMTSCERRTVGHTYIGIPASGWQKADTLTYHISLPDSDACYRLFVELRHHDNYPYQHLLLTMGCVLTDKATADSPVSEPYQPALGPHHTDTLCFRMANSQGVWMGRGWGGLYQNRFGAGSLCIQRPADCVISLASALPDSVLVGINDVGVKVERIGPAH